MHLARTVAWAENVLDIRSRDSDAALTGQRCGARLRLESSPTRLQRNKMFENRAREQSQQQRGCGGTAAWAPEDPGHRRRRVSAGCYQPVSSTQLTNFDFEVFLQAALHFSSLALRLPRRKSGRCVTAHVHGSERSRLEVAIRHGSVEHPSVGTDGARRSKLALHESCASKSSVYSTSLVDHTSTRRTCCASHTRSRPSTAAHGAAHHACHVGHFECLDGGDEASSPGRGVGPFVHEAVVTCAAMRVSESDDWGRRRTCPATVLRTEARR